MIYYTTYNMTSKQTVKVDSNAVSEDMVNAFKLSMNPNAIPDLGELMGTIEAMLQFMETDHMKELEKVNKAEFETLVYGRYNDIIPMKIISLMVDDNRYENLDGLLDMFDILTDVKNGKKNIHEEAEKFGEKQNAKFVYPQFGGKENFEKMMAKKTKKKKNKMPPTKK